MPTRSEVAHRLKTCRHCGKKGLVWREIDGRWRLCEKKGAVHTCAQYRESR